MIWVIKIVGRIRMIGGVKTVGIKTANMLNVLKITSALEVCVRYGRYVEFLCAYHARDRG